MQSQLVAGVAVSTEAMTSKDDTTGEHRTTQGATEADGFHVYTLKVSKKAAKTGNKSTDLYEGFLASRHTFEEDVG